MFKIRYFRDHKISRRSIIRRRDFRTISEQFTICWLQTRRLWRPTVTIVTDHKIISVSRDESKKTWSLVVCHLNRRQRHFFVLSFDTVRATRGHVSAGVFWEGDRGGRRSHDKRQTIHTSRKNAYKQSCFSYCKPMSNCQCPNILTQHHTLGRLYDLEQIHIALLLALWRFHLLSPWSVSVQLCTSNRGIGSVFFHLNANISTNSVPLPERNRAKHSCKQDIK